MDWPLAIGLVVLGATGGALVVAAWMSDARPPMVDHDNGEMPENIEARARSMQ
jgi:hypothetical protein